MLITIEMTEDHYEALLEVAEDFITKSNYRDGLTILESELFDFLIGAITAYEDNEFRKN